MDYAIKYQVNVQKIPLKGVHIQIDATSEELNKLKTNHNLIDIRSFHVECKILPYKKDSIKLTGRIIADLSQQCVATLAPINVNYNEDINVIYIKESSKLNNNLEDKVSKELHLNYDNDIDFFEIYTGNTIDIGAISEEFFELGLDPYPRVKDTQPIVFSTDNDIEQYENTNLSQKSPFNILSKLRD